MPRFYEFADEVANMDSSTYLNPDSGKFEIKLIAKDGLTTTFTDNAPVITKKMVNAYKHFAAIKFKAIREGHLKPD